MRKQDFIGKVIIQIMVFGVIISAAAFAVAAPPLPIPDVPAVSIFDIKPISLIVFHENYTDQGPWIGGEIIRIRGYYYIYGCPNKPFFGKIAIDGNTNVEQTMEQRPNCTGYSNSMLSFDANFNTNWQATAGTHTIIFTVDSKNDIAEGIKEAGNTLIKTITVVAPIPSTIPVPLSRGK